MLPLSVLIPIGLVALLYLCLVWTYSYWSRRGVPQENPFKLFGRFNDFTICRENYINIYKTIYNKDMNYPFQGVYSLFRPSLFLRDPDLIKDVMLNKSRVFSDTGSHLDEEADPIMSGDPFFQTGQKWKDGRARFSTLGTPARLRAIFPFLVEICEPMNEYIRKLQHESGRGDGTEARELCNKFVTDGLVSVLLGGKANSFASEQSIFQEIGRAVFHDSFYQNLAMLMVIGAPHLSKILKLRFLPKATADLLSRLIKDEALRRKQNGVVRNDIFDAIIKKTEYSDEEQAHLTLVRTIVTFYIEGFESSSLVSAYTLFNLAKNPDIQQRLRQQIREKSPPQTPLTEEIVSDIPLLTNCILEAMRLVSPVTLLQRQTKEDYTLEAATGEKVFLNKGTIVAIPLIGLHHNPRVFPNPDIFDPDRMHDPEQRHYFMGFGDGPRLCLGQRYAQQSMAVLVASIIRDFHVEISAKMKLPLKFASHPFFLYPQDGLWLRFVPV